LKIIQAAFVTFGGFSRNAGILYFASHLPERKYTVDERIDDDEMIEKKTRQITDCQPFTCSAFVVKESVDLTGSATG
jgi:hypothetical protein